MIAGRGGGGGGRWWAGGGAGAEWKDENVGLPNFKTDSWAAETLLEEDKICTQAPGSVGRRDACSGSGSETPAEMPVVKTTCQLHRFFGYGPLSFSFLHPATALTRSPHTHPRTRAHVLTKP
jgi:hypothetical protein